MKRLLIVLITLVSFSGNCTPISFIFGGWCKHIGSQPTSGNEYYYIDHGEKIRELNEDNPTYGIEYDNWTVATSVLSYNNRGYSLFYTWEPELLSFEYADVGLRLGGVYGYADTPVKLLIAPIFEPVVEIKPIDEFSIELGMMPHIESVIFTANLKINFG